MLALRATPRFPRGAPVGLLLLFTLLCPALLVRGDGTIDFDDLEKFLSGDINKTALLAHLHKIWGGLDGSGSSPPVGGGGTPPPAPAPPALGGLDPLCDLKFGGIRRSILMVADEGDFSGTSEASYYKSAITNDTVIPTNQTYCLYWSYGSMLGQPIVLAASGIGPVTTVVCITEIMSCALYVKELIYTGTSGWSPAVGGVINPPAPPAPAVPRVSKTMSAHPRRRAALKKPLAPAPVDANGTCSLLNNGTQKVRLGDICIFTHAINWECKQADWLGQCGTTGNQCYYPIEAKGPEASFLYGKCVFETLSTADISLADEFIAATKTPLWNQKVQVLSQRRDKDLAAYEDAWWKNTAAGSGQSGFYPLPTYTVPYVFDYKTCTEVDGQFFYSGAPWEFVARQYAAINLRSDKSAAGRPDATAQDVVAVAAMEAVGTLGALVEFYSNPKAPKFPYVLLRAASNYLMGPLKQTSPGVWNYYEPELVDPFSAGYGYAIASVSSAVLTTFALRCQAQFGVNTICDFTLNAYNPPMTPSVAQPVGAVKPMPLPAQSRPAMPEGVATNAADTAQQQIPAVSNVVQQPQAIPADPLGQPMGSTAIRGAGTDAAEVVPAANGATRATVEAAMMAANPGMVPNQATAVPNQATAVPNQATAVPQTAAVAPAAEQRNIIIDPMDLLP